MWTTEQRQAHERRGLRYPSDLTDAEWTLVEPFIPPAKRGGRRRTVDVREVLNGLLYVLATGCQWRALPKDLPPKSTVHDYLTLWAWDGTVKLVLARIEKQRRSSALWPHAAALAPVTSAQIANACARTARYSAAGR
jgi:transposase